jgi:class 3 adenylate cyclase
MTEQDVQRRLAAVLVADVAGYTRMMEADEQATLDAWWSAASSPAGRAGQEQARRIPYEHR